FVRAYPGPGGRTVVDVGGLARSDAAGAFETEFTTLAGEISSAHRGSEPAVPARSPVPGSGAGGPPVSGDQTEGE
ncbi:MAG TPA: hypothetical protein VGF32_09745, partial [Streptosporangiaceae bacterium]